MNNISLQELARRNMQQVRCCAGLFLVLNATSTFAAQITVTHFDDELDDTNGTCTLREAIRTANSDVNVDACSRKGANGADNILLLAGRYSVDLANPEAEDFSLKGDLDITSEVSIRGVSPDHTIIDGDMSSSQERVFDVMDGRLTLADLSVSGGHEPAADGGNVRVGDNSIAVFTNVVVSNGRARRGGGIFGGNVVSLTHTFVRDNATLGEDGVGGGIAFLDGTSLDLDNTTVSNNMAAFGGGLLAAGSSLSIVDSRIEGNTAAGSGTNIGNSGFDGGTGGGIAAGTATGMKVRRTLIADNEAVLGGGFFWAGPPGGDNEISHSAIVNNAAAEKGGGIYAVVEGSIRFSTISGNTAATGGGIYTNSTMTLLDSATLADNSGGGLFNESGAVIEYSLLADNNNANCNGQAPLSGPYNLDSGNSCSFPINDPLRPSFLNANALLGPLQDNGGGLPTHALLPGSPAIDAYSSEFRGNCQIVPDQRTYSRGFPPQEVAAVSIYFCDIGAYEVSPPFVVDSSDDTVDANIKDGVCADANGGCSLRAAVMQANVNPGFNEIELGAGTYALTLAGADEDLGETGDLDIGDDLLIRGQGMNTTIVDGAGLDRIFGTSASQLNNLQPNIGIIQLQDLTLQNGVAAEGGAGLESVRHVELSRVALRDNAAIAGIGGALSCRDQCRMSIRDSLVDGNSATGNGGAIFSASNEIPGFLLERTTLSNNTGRLGGAVGANDTMRAINSTFSGNMGQQVGAIFGSRVILENATVTNNEASASGGTGALLTLDASTMVNTIIAGNRAGGTPDNCVVSEETLSLGHNLSDTDSTDCSLGHASDLVDTDPVLGVLAENGGLTPTHMPAAGSPAIEGGDNLRCPILDQRGFLRPDDADGDGIADCDIGAIELLSADVSISISATPNPAIVGNNVSINIVVANNGPGDASDIEVTTTLPAGMIFVSGTISGNACTVASGEVSCQLVQIDSNTSATAMLVTTASQAGSHPIAATVTTGSADSGAGNNDASLTLSVNTPGSGGPVGSGSGGGGGSLGALGLLLLFARFFLLGCIKRGARDKFEACQRIF